MSKRLLLIVAGLILFLAFVCFSYLVHRNHFTASDFNTTVRLQDHLPRRLDGPFSFLSEVGKFEVVTIVLIALFLVFRKIKAGIIALGFYIGFHLIEIYGKYFVHHPPPPQFMVRTTDLLPLSPFEVRSQNSYPSGHAGRALFLSAIILVLLWQSKRVNLPLKIFGTLCVAGYDGVMLLSRVYLGEHWFSDIIGGSLLGAAFGLFASVFLLNTHQHSSHTEKKTIWSHFPKYKIEIKKEE